MVIYSQEGLNPQIRLAFLSYKVSNIFSVKDPIPVLLYSLVAYKFSCTGCHSVYAGGTCQHTNFLVQDVIPSMLVEHANMPTFSIHVCEHLARDKNSHIYKHLISSRTCRNTVSNKNCFTILDTAKYNYQLKLKEALHINWLKPTLSSQLSHANLTLDL